MDKDKHDLFVGRKSLMLPDRDGDPTEGMANLLDLFVLIGVGLMISAMTSFGMGDLLGSKSTTIVTNPGTKQQTITIKANGTISTYKPSDKSATGAGTALGTIYQLADGTKVFVPAGTSPAATSTP